MLRNVADADATVWNASARPGALLSTNDSTCWSPNNTEGETAFATVTVTGVEVATFPAASRATAASTCEPFARFVVFHATEYGADVSSAPRFAPSSLNWTPATPTLSDALAETVIVPETVEPAEGDVMVTLGGEVSF